VLINRLDHIHKKAIVVLRGVFAHRPTDEVRLQVYDNLPEFLAMVSAGEPFEGERSLPAEVARNYVLRMPLRNYRSS
jgi:hypothetical protein